MKSTNTNVTSPASKPQLSPELQAQIDAIVAAKLAEKDAEIAALKASKTRAIRAKATDKGGISLYGVGRYPVTLYPDQWDVVFAEGKAHVEACYAENKATLDAKSAAHKAAKAAAKVPTGAKVAQ